MLTHSAGPSVTVGSAPALTGQNTQGLNPDAGPNVDYHGSAVIDVRYQYRNGDWSKGAIKAMLNYAFACTLDTVPSIKSNVIVAAAQTPVVPAGGSIAMTLASANVVSPGTNGNLAVNVPLVPYVGSGAATSGLSIANRKTVLCLDPGHTVGTTTSTSATVASVGDTRLITPGQYVCLPGAGSSATQPLIARVTAKTQNADGTGTLTLDTAAGTSVSAGPIMLMEYRQLTDFSGGASVVPWYYDGAIALFDPHSNLCRALSLTTAGTIASGYTVTVAGYDVYGVPMTETISVPTSASTVLGKKAWKYIASATLNFAGGGTPGSTIAIGTSDIIGMNLKSELWEYGEIFTAGAFVSTSTGYTAAVTTTATATTGDVRGTYTLQSGATSDGTRRVAMFMSLPARQALAANYDNYVSLFGVTHF
jgi:hypothetical protein